MSTLEEIVLQLPGGVNNITIQEEIFTDKVRVYGLPLFLKGWNALFYKTDEISEGSPVYRLDPYMLYYVIAIVGVKLIFRNGKWSLVRDDDRVMFIKHNNKELFGEWGYYGMKVESVSSNSKVF